jgi:hypothetical protein
MNRLILGFIITALAGCSTGAQRQGEVIRTNSQHAIQGFRACISAAFNMPEAGILHANLPAPGTQPSLQQLTSHAKATPKELQAFYLLHDKNNECRTAFWQEVQQTTPSLVPVFVRSANQQEALEVRLINQELTWGEFLLENRKRAENTDREVREEGRRIDAGLQQSHQAEMAARQNAANAMAQFSRDMQVQQQNQQMINNMNRPVITNCVSGINSVNCVTH